MQAEGICEDTLFRGCEFRAHGYGKDIYILPGTSTSAPTDRSESARDSVVCKSKFLHQTGTIYTDSCLGKNACLLGFEAMQSQSRELLCMLSCHSSISKRTKLQSS